MPETGPLPISGRYFFNDDAPAYPGLHCFGSRNWHEHDGDESTPIYGEAEGIKQQWNNGAFPPRKPLPRIVGTPECIENGDSTIFPLPLPIAPLPPLPTPPALPPFSVSYLGENWRAKGGGRQSGSALFLYFKAAISCEGYVLGVPVACWDDIPPHFCGKGGGKQDGNGTFAFSATWSASGGGKQSGGASFNFTVNEVWFASGGGKQNGSSSFTPGYPWFASGGGKQDGAAIWHYIPAWFASGGGKQDGAAIWHYIPAWFASGGGKQDGAATWWKGFAWFAAGGGKQDGAATWWKGFKWNAAGGGKQDGAATWSKGFAWSGSGGGKQDGAATMGFGGKLYTRSTNTDTTCDVGGVNNYDLGYGVGSGTSTIAPTNSTTYSIRGDFDIAVTWPNGNITVSLNATTVNSFTSFKFRFQVIDSSCAVLSSSAYSSDFTTTGVKTLSAALTWPAGGVRLRISIEVKRVGGTGLNFTALTITNDSSSYIQLTP